MTLSFTLPGPTDRDQIRQFGRDSLPGWFYAVDRPEEDLESSASVMALALGQAREWTRDTFIANAEGKWLEGHARDRGVYPRATETAEQLRSRIKTVEDLVTEPALLAEANRILAAGSGGTAFMFTLEMERAFLGKGRDGFDKAYCGRGYRCGRDRPGRIICILPFGTTQTEQDAVDDMIAQKKAAGFLHTVERRLVA